MKMIKIPLSKYCTVIVGKDKPTDFSEEKNAKYQIPIYANGIENDGIVGYTNKALIQQEAVTVSARGNVGTAFYRSEPFVPIIRLLVILTDKQYIDTKYLYYVLKNMSIFGVGSIQKQLTRPDMEKKIISIFEDVEYQKRIAKILSRIDDKIYNNNKIISELESMAKTIYDYWFLQYEFPNEEGKPYKSSGGKMVYNEELKREIPVGWKVGTLSNIADFIMGQSPKSSAYNDLGEGLPLINGAVELSSNGININKYTTEYNRVCKVNDLLFCIRATLGNIQFADREYCLGRGVASARPKEDIYTEYVYQVLNYMISYFETILSGSIIVGMTKDDIADFTTIIPPKNIMDKYHNASKDSLITCRKLKDENKELQDLRDYLLPLLMNGQVSFKN